jgi:beta-glucanase (GH16 family)
MCGRSTSITVPSGYAKLSWHDEFDVNGAPSSANWGYETGFVRNNELQWYQSQNAAVSGGLLTITAKREQVTNPNYNPNGSDWKTTRQYAQYTSTSMTTSGKQSWKFGRFEMCGKIPITKGMWPAWWTLGVSGEWPANGEIDIMEYYNGKILANIAWATSTRWSAHWDSSTKAVDATWATQYHLWRMDWDSTKIDLYVDDALMNTGNLSAMLNDTNGQSPFLQNAYMIVNLAIGGDNGGDPSSTTFPQQYLIDYIRVFQ